MKNSKHLILFFGFIIQLSINSATAQNQFSNDLNDYVLDLSSLFANNQEFNEARITILEKIKKVEGLKKSNLSIKENLIEALDLMYETRVLASKMARYGFLKSKINNTNETQNLKNIGIEKEVQVEGKVAFIEEAIRDIAPKKLQGWINTEPRITKHKRRINKILLKAPYTLPAGEQKILEVIQQWTKKPFYTYLSLLDSNLGWTAIQLNDNKELIVDHKGFNKYKRHSNSEIRERVGKSYFDNLKTHEKTFGKIITNRIEAEATIANLRGFENGMDALWFLRDGMPLRSYDPMINIINKNFDVLNRYIDLKRKLLKKDKFTYYDLYAPLSKISKEITIKEALNISIEASKPLGKNYQELLRKKINSNLIHLAPTEKKDKFYYGISQPIGDAHAYIIMSYYNDVPSSEALMGALTAMMKSEMIPIDERPDTGDDPGIYANSTIYIGTSLHSDYLYKIAKSKEERISILSTAIERIWARVFRYVLIVEWEKEIGKKIALSDTPSGEDLSKMYMKLIKKYYKNIYIPNEVSAEWMTYRIPFYSYEHQFWPAAMAGACSIINRLNEGDKKALNILNVLGKTDMDMTYTLYKEVGIDMTTEEPYIEIIKRMSYLMDLLEEELN